MSAGLAPTLPEGVRLRSACSCGWARHYGDDFDPETVRLDLREHLAGHGAEGESS